MTASRSQEANVIPWPDTKNGWRNGSGYIAFGKPPASSPSFLTATTSLTTSSYRRPRKYGRNLTVTTSTPPSWNANATTNTSTPATLNTNPDVRVSRVAKRRTKWEGGEPYHQLCPPYTLRAPLRPGQGWRDLTVVLVTFTLPRWTKWRDPVARPHPPASPKHDTRVLQRLLTNSLQVTGMQKINAPKRGSRWQGFSVGTRHGTMDVQVVTLPPLM